MSEEDIRKAVEPLLLEYFDNGDCDEVFMTLADLKITLFFLGAQHPGRDAVEYWH